MINYTKYTNRLLTANSGHYDVQRDNTLCCLISSNLSVANKGLNIFA